MRAGLVWWGAVAAAVALQATLAPLLLPDAWRPDATRALVLWLALTGVPRGGPAAAAGAGLAVDVVSGGPLGLCAALRLLLYGAARPFRGVFFDDHPALLIPLALLGPLADGVGVAALSHFLFPHPLPASVMGGLLARQAVADLLIVPLLFLALEAATGRRPRREVPA